MDKVFQFHVCQLFVFRPSQTSLAQGLKPLVARWARHVFPFSLVFFFGGFHLFQKPQVCASAAEHILIMCSAETDSSSDHEARQSDKAVLLNPTCSIASWSAWWFMWCGRLQIRIVMGCCSWNYVACFTAGGDTMFFFLILGKQRLERLGWTCGTDRALGCARAANRQWSHHILAQCRYVAHAHTWLPIGILENLPGLTGRSQNNPKIKGSRMTLKHQFPWNEGMKHPPWPWDQQPIGAQLTLHSFREAIRTLLALGALPRTLNADVWAEPRSGEIQISIN